MASEKKIRRVSDYFGLEGDQSVFEFVDVAMDSDSPLFLDPRAFRSIRSDWGEECISLLQSFFDEVLSLVQAGDHSAARQLLGSLSEPNETHLGFSRGKPSGSGMGRGLAEVMWEALSGSDAAASGLLQDLEDTVLFIEGIGHDRISDITTNIVRGPLSAFTKDVATYYDIPLKEGVASGRCWNSSLRKWEVGFVELPVVENRPLLLVPKCLVRRRLAFDAGEYLDHHILPILQEEELKAGSSLVQVLKDGTSRVTKKSVKEKYGRSKRLAREVTTKHPEALERYRVRPTSRRSPPSHRELADTLDVDPPDWDGLLANVRKVSPGKEGADRYHRAVQALLSAIFYPSLVNPRREVEIHEGRKRIDITFTNAANKGFFSWAHEKVVRAPYLFVECKNYGSEIANPELDQLAGRFSDVRGQLGIVCCRSFQNRALWQARCKDTANDGRGYILTISDEDLLALVEERRASEDRPWAYDLLREQLDALLL